MLLIAAIACTPSADEAEVPVSLVVPLRWTAEPGGITWEEAEAGLAWSLSNLGALPPRDGWLTVVYSDEHTTLFEVDLEQVGFDPMAMEALQSAVTPIVQSDELQTLGAVDVGRFLMRTLYSPWRYYSITGACTNVSDWMTLSQSGFVEQYGVTVSLLTAEDRRLTLNEGPWDGIDQIGFSARSGEGVIAEPETTLEVEVIDLMSNGQQRYAVFDIDGMLAPAADPEVISAGQPGKCMWCHEGSLMTGTPVNPTSRPHLSYPEWSARISRMQSLLETHRYDLDTSVDFFDDDRTHTHGELLTREFLYPTPARMQREWGISSEDLSEVLRNNNVSTTLDVEYPERGPVLERADLDAVYAAELAEPGHIPLTILTDDRNAPPLDAVLDGEAERLTLPQCWKP